MNFSSAFKKFIVLLTIKSKNENINKDLWQPSAFWIIGNVILRIFIFKLFVIIITNVINKYFQLVAIDLYFWNFLVHAIKTKRVE